jgi:hypothetical protein
VRLQDGWDSGLRKIDKAIAFQNAAISAFQEEMHAEMERIKDSYKKRFEPIQNALGELRNARQSELAKIADSNPGLHPQVSLPIKDDMRAAEVLASYWQGDEIDRDHLLNSVRGLGDIEVYRQAHTYAVDLTKQGSPERAVVDAAIGKLWENSTK